MHCTILAVTILFHNSSVSLELYGTEPYNYDPVQSMTLHGAGKCPEPLRF